MMEERWTCPETGASRGDLSGEIMSSLEDAKALVREKLDEGVICPCCDQYARRYRRKFNSTMARSLLWLVNECGVAGLDARQQPVVLINDRFVGPLEVDWINVARTAPRWLVRSNQLPTVRWWGLVERPRDVKDPKRKHSGLWRPTKLGLWFATGSVALPGYAVTYRGEKETLNGDYIYIQDTLGEHFNYGELMEANYGD